MLSKLRCTGVELANGTALDSSLLLRSCCLLLTSLSPDAVMGKSRDRLLTCPVQRLIFASVVTFDG